MRINGVSNVPGRPATAVLPIVPPGKYSVKLKVDGVEEVEDFELFMNPKEPYSQEQADGKFEFWKELYNAAESRTQKVLNALAKKKETEDKLKNYKSSGVKQSKIEKAEAQAQIIYKIVDEYEGAYVSTGRTLAEVINLPATILFKMSFMSGILDHSEGPVTEQMKAEFKKVLEEADNADAKYESSIDPELSKFDKLVK